jgi:hypothetical protein
MLLAWVLCLTLSPLPPFIKVAAAASAQAELAKVQDLAGRYAQAMKAIGQVAEMPLRNAQEIQTALGILRRYDADLGLWWYRMVQVAMSQPTFQQGVRERLRAYLASAPSVQAKARSAAQSSPGKEIRIPVGEEIQAFIKQIQANPGMIRNWPEVSAAEQAMRQQLKADAEVLRRVGANLRRAAERRGSSVMPGADAVVTALEDVLGRLLTALGDIDLAPPAYAIIDPVSLTIAFVIVVVIGIAVVACIGLTISSCVPSGPCTVCGIPPTELSVPSPPLSPYDQCIAECVAWRENCIAKESDEKKKRDCVYRYYDDCAWSSSGTGCELLRQQ